MAIVIQPASAGLDISALSSATPVNADLLVFSDTSDSGNNKKVTTEEMWRRNSITFTNATLAGQSPEFSNYQITSGSTSNILSANTVQYTPVYLPEGTYTKIGMEVTSTSLSGGEVGRLGIYNVGSNGLPGSLVLDAGTVTLTSAAIKTITISQPLRGKYFLAVILQAGCTTRNDVMSGASNLFSGCVPGSANRYVAVTKTVASGELAGYSNPSLVPNDYYAQSIAQVRVYVSL